MRSHLAHRKDANHTAIVETYTQLGCSVLDLHAVGSGCPDTLIGCVGEQDLVEIKTPDGELEPSQVRFNRDWRGRKPRVVRTVDEAVAHVSSMRRRVPRGTLGE